MFSFVIKEFYGFGKDIFVIFNFFILNVGNNIYVIELFL